MKKNKTLLNTERLPEETLLELLKETDELAISEICDSAEYWSQKITGPRTTYIVNRNINFTNVCAYSCLFCGYREEHGATSAHTANIDEILALAEGAVKNLGVDEFCITGGLNPALKFDYYTALLSELRSAFPTVHRHAYSPEEVHWLARRYGKSFAWVLEQLKEAGLDSMPGTAAEILDDEIRKQICPQKLSTAEWREVIVTAHRLGIPTTSTMLAGHIERNENIVNHLRLLREIQEETHGFTEFVPLPFVPYQTPLKSMIPAMLSPMRAKQLHAVARLYFKQLIPNIQVSWVKLGKELAAEILRTGASDVGGTLMEENITRKAGGNFGQMLSEKELQTLIISAGKTPVRRTTLYDRLTPIAENHCSSHAMQRRL